MGSLHARVVGGVVLLALLLTALVGDHRADAIGEGVPVVFVSDGVGYADALVGATLAAAHNAPLLTVANPRDGDLVPQETADELERLQPQSIVILGGTAAVSDEVAQELATFTSGEVTRVKGATRFGTAAAISETLPGKVGNADLLDGKDSSDFVSNAEADAMMPRVFAQRDVVPKVVFEPDVTAASRVEVNQVTVRAPVDGVLVIHGTTFVNNEGPDPVKLVLEPRLDGASTQEAGWGALGEAAAHGSIQAADGLTLSYTVTVEVSAGRHEVSQHLGPLSDSTDLSYDQQSLTVQFYPGRLSSLS